MKGSLVVIVIAMGLSVFLVRVSRFIKCLTSMIAGFLVAGFLMNAVFSSIIPISDELKDEYQFPATHWIMMGLTGAGNYNADDVQYTSSFSSFEERKNATESEISKRIKNLGIGGVLHQFYKKATTYGWNYGTCYAERYLGDLGDMPKLRSILHEFVLSKGAYHKHFRLYADSMWLLILGFVALSFVTAIFSKETLESYLLKLSVVGWMMFFMIWETHPRYILHFTPVVVLVAVLSMEHANDLLKTAIKQCVKSRAF